MAPNGERIAFAQGLVIRNNGGVVVRKELVKVVWPDGTHGRTVATLTAVSSGRFTSLDWSPDSRKIAITTQRGLWIAQANGKRAQLIVPRPGAAAAVWSPRGDRIAFMRAFNRHGELTAAHDIYIVSPNGSNFHRTTTAQGYGGQPVSWSPDGQRIVYSTRRNTHLANSTLHSLDVDTGVTLTLGLGDSPTWSPRGDLIAFSINQNDGAGGPVLAIAVERPDGTGRRVLAKAYTQPVWSPSGEQIAFGKYVEHGLWRVPAGGGTPQKIASGGQVNHIEWSR
jgi:TolB protein